MGDNDHSFYICNLLSVLNLMYCFLAGTYIATYKEYEKSN